LLRNQASSVGNQLDNVENEKVTTFKPTIRACTSHEIHRAPGVPALCKQVDNDLGDYPNVCSPDTDLKLPLINLKNKGMMPDPRFPKLNGMAQFRANMIPCEGDCKKKSCGDTCVDGSQVQWFNVKKHRLEFLGALTALVYVIARINNILCKTVPPRGCAWCEMGFDPSRQGMWGPWPSPRGAKKRIQEGDADWENRIETPQALVGVCPQKLTKKCPSWMLKDVIDVQGPGFTEWKKNQPEARRIAHRLLTNNLGEAGKTRRRRWSLMRKRSGGTSALGKTFTKVKTSVKQAAVGAAKHALQKVIKMIVEKLPIINEFNKWRILKALKGMDLSALRHATPDLLVHVVPNLLWGIIHRFSLDEKICGECEKGSNAADLGQLFCKNVDRFQPVLSKGHPEETWIALPSLELHGMDAGQEKLFEDDYTFFVLLDKSGPDKTIYQSHFKQLPYLLKSNWTECMLPKCYSAARNQRNYKTSKEPEPEECEKMPASLDFLEQGETCAEKYKAPSCASKFTISLSFCNTCCCANGDYATTTIHNELVHGEEAKCGAWMLMVDMAVRVYIGAFRTVKVSDRFNTVCFK